MFNFLIQSTNSFSFFSDSFLFSAQLEKNQSVEDKLLENKDQFDFSNLPENSRLYDKTHKNQLNRYFIFKIVLKRVLILCLRFKLESKDKRIVAVCSLRSKLYAVLYSDKNELLKMKGVPYSAFRKNSIRFQAYLDCIEGKRKKKAQFYRIGCKKHQVSHFLQSKSALISSFDDKRWLLPCKVN